MGSADTIRDVPDGSVRRIPVEELPQHLATLEQELAGGQSIELTRGNAVVAELRAKLQPEERDGQKPWLIPDFLGQMREAFGDFVFPDGTVAGLIDEDRGPR